MTQGIKKGLSHDVAISDRASRRAGVTKISLKQKKNLRKIRVFSFIPQKRKYRPSRRISVFHASLNRDLTLSIIISTAICFSLSIFFSLSLFDKQSKVEENKIRFSSPSLSPISIDFAPDKSCRRRDPKPRFD